MQCGMDPRVKPEGDGGEGLTMASRPAIPAVMKRAIQEEAGYRCAVPTCRDKGPFDFEHIDEWSKVKKHEEHNIVLLCVSCHARVTRKEIHKDAIKAYKRNLAIINGRYSQFEIRLLEKYWEEGLKLAPESSTHLTHTGTIPTVFDEVHMIHLKGLQRDGLISVKEHNFYGLMNPAAKSIADAVGQEHAHTVLGAMNMNQYAVTPTFKALEFIKDYFGGREIK